MKKLRVLVLTLCMGISLVSCYGPFKLTSSLHSWNGQATSDEFVNALIFVGLNIIPVYGIAALADAIIFNTIEFWTGVNPIAMKAGEKETKVVEENGQKYQITATQNQFEIIQVEGTHAGAQAFLIFKPEEKAWYLKNEEVNVKLSEVKGNKINAFFPDGTALSFDSKVTSFEAEAMINRKLSLNYAAK